MHLEISIHDNVYWIAFLSHKNTHSKLSFWKGFDSLQDQWLEQYEAKDFPNDVYKVWTEETEISGRKISLEKFYQQLHAYVRRKLQHFYDKQVSGYIRNHTNQCLFRSNLDLFNIQFFISLIRCKMVRMNHLFFYLNRIANVIIY